MRTTLDLPEDLLTRARAIAHDTGRGLSSVVADLVRRGLDTGPAREPVLDSATGLPLVSVGRVITSDDVRALEDEA
jgi:hypothetical protein